MTGFDEHVAMGHGIFQRAKLLAEDLSDLEPHIAAMVLQIASIKTAKRAVPGTNARASLAAAEGFKIVPLVGMVLDLMESDGIPSSSADNMLNDLLKRGK